MSSLKVVLCAALLVAVVQAARVPRDDKYTTKYDNINIDEILKNERILQSYIKCILDKGKCTPDGVELKKNLPDSLTNECANCSEIQRKGSEKVIRHLIKNNHEAWKELEAKYDPTGIYQTRYDAQLKELQEAEATTAVPTTTA